MSDLWSEHHGPLQMSREELLNHVMETRVRRRARSESPKRKAKPKKAKAKSDPKKDMAKLSVEDLKKVLELINERNS